MNPNIVVFVFLYQIAHQSLWMWFLIKEPVKYRIIEQNKQIKISVYDKLQSCSISVLDV